MTQHQSDKGHLTMLRNSQGNREEIARRTLSMYLQSWGQSAQDQIDALNAAAEAAELVARFEQGPNGENAGWRGRDSERASAFRKRIDNCWRGSFEEEVAAIEGVIAEFAAKRDLQRETK